MFNINSDGGPGYQITQLFMTFLNQTTSFLAPFLGMAGGNPLAFFNGIIQQFMAVFGQVTGLWSNTVNRQMQLWSASLPPPQTPEYEMVNKTIVDLSRVQGEVEKLPLLASSRNEQVFKETATRARLMMDTIYRCMDGRTHPFLLPRQSLFPPRPLTPAELGQLTLQYQEEIINLWRLISNRIAYDMRHPFRPLPYGCHPPSPVDDERHIDFEDSNSLPTTTMKPRMTTTKRSRNVEFEMLSQPAKKEP